jgi:hypothetical protein
VATDLELIYCANGNKRFAQIAIDAGFLYGAQMPGTVYYDLHFVDLHPERPPNQWDYVSKLRRHQPTMASVHDWHAGRGYQEIMLRAEEIAEHVRESILLIPKVPGTIKKIPRHINSRRVVLGYSVPTRHGKTDVPMLEFSGWPVHLLGGSPQRQMQIHSEMRNFADVVSVDGNMHLKMATQFNSFFDPCKTTQRGFWPSLVDYDGRKWGDGSGAADAPYEAFARSCRNIISAWRQ